GEKVCHIVEEVTEDLELKKLDNKGTWRERKILYLAHLYRASFEAIMVCCADKIHNLTNMIQLTNKKESSRVWSQFNSPPEDRLWFYKEVTLCLQKKLNHPIVRELEKTFEEAEKVIPLKKNQGAIEKMTAVGHPFR
ncbi:MAG: hypothetical protein HY609_01390, partial [Deltaproteobacteria bacterium]|nr:hypothetical protein [Deltaproteobacteria bacterium]